MQMWPTASHLVAAVHPAGQPRLGSRLARPAHHLRLGRIPDRRDDGAPAAPSSGKQSAQEQGSANGTNVFALGRSHNAVHVMTARCGGKLRQARDDRQVAVRRMGASMSQQSTLCDHSAHLPRRAMSGASSATMRIGASTPAASWRSQVSGSPAGHMRE